MIAHAPSVASQIEASLMGRNAPFQEFFQNEAGRLSEACCEMADRFRRGGRLLAFGQGACATDAQHVSVEFVHPVLVGKRALPALDVSSAFDGWVQAIVHPEDMLMGFGPPEGDAAVDRVLRRGEQLGAMTLALPGDTGSYSFRHTALHPFLHQELIEVLYHTLWETVHVFLEHGNLNQAPGAAGFLYPFLGDQVADSGLLLHDVAESILTKVEEDAKLRVEVARTQSLAIADAAFSMRDRVEQGGKLILFGNGGSATDANDFMLDCVRPPAGYTPVPAISLSMEPANLTALANDVGSDVLFSRQLMAHSSSADIAVAISTSGGSRNIIAALEEARRRGLLTVGLLGYDGGEIARRGLVDHALIVPSDYIPRIQEVQATIYHTLRGFLEPKGR